MPVGSWEYMIFEGCVRKYMYKEVENMSTKSFSTDYYYDDDNVVDYVGVALELSWARGVRELELSVLH